MKSLSFIPFLLFTISNAFAQDSSLRFMIGHAWQREITIDRGSETWKADWKNFVTAAIGSACPADEGEPVYRLTHFGGVDFITGKKHNDISSCPDYLRILEAIDLNSYRISFCTQYGIDTMVLKVISPKRFVLTGTSREFDNKEVTISYQRVKMPSSIRKFLKENYTSDGKSINVGQ